MTLSRRAELYDVKLPDLNLILEWRNKDSIRSVMFNSEIITSEQHHNWFTDLNKSQSNITKIFSFDGIPYGVLNINKIDKINNSCEWGFYIGSQSSPKGMGTILGYTALNYIFDELLIRKISAQVLDNNSRSIYFHEKLGFSKEGILREQIVRNNSYLDVTLFGYLKSEWKRKLPALKESIERSLI